MDNRRLSFANKAATMTSHRQSEPRTSSTRGQARTIRGRTNNKTEVKFMRKLEMKKDNGCSRGMLSFFVLV